MYNNINLVYNHKNKSKYIQRREKSLVRKVGKLFLFILTAYFVF